MMKERRTADFRSFSDVDASPIPAPGSRLRWPRAGGGGGRAAAHTPLLVSSAFGGVQGQEGRLLPFLAAERDELKAAVADFKASSWVDKKGYAAAVAKACGVPLATSATATSGFMHVKKTKAGTFSAVLPGGASAGPAWKRRGIVCGSRGLAARCSHGSRARGLLGSRTKTSAAHERPRRKCTTRTLYCGGPDDLFTRTPTMTPQQGP